MVELQPPLPPPTARSPGPPGPGLVFEQELRRSAADLAGLEAAGADVEALVGAVQVHPDPLDVGVKAPLGDLLRPRPVVAEGRLLGADVADGSHGDTPEWETDRGPRAAGNRERISDAPARGRITARAPSRRLEPQRLRHYPGSRPIVSGPARGAYERRWKHPPVGGSTSRSSDASWTSRSMRWRPLARRSTPSTSIPCRTATPARTCTS